MPKSLIALLVAVVCLVLALAIGIWAFLETYDDGAVDGGTTGAAEIGGSFSLTDQFGQTRVDGEFRGKLMLVYFGFTNCPDVCPFDLQKMTDALQALPAAEAAEVTPIFITVDPARDDVAAMQRYAANFHPSLVALTGDKAALDAVAKAYRVYAAPSDQGGGMSHSSIIYLMDRDGRYLTHFAQDATAADLAKTIEADL